MNKKSSAIDDWIKTVAPSAKLDTWLNQDPTRWSEFCHRYAREIPTEILDELRALAGKGIITLVYWAKNQDHNTATALKALMIEIDTPMSAGSGAERAAPKPNGTDTAQGASKTDLARWDTEGGAGPEGPQEQSKNSAVSTELLRPANYELAHLRIRVIALENLIIILLAEASDRQVQMAREMAKFIAPQPGVTAHPLAIHASAHMVGLIERASHLHVQTPR